MLKLFESIANYIISMDIWTSISMAGLVVEDKLREQLEGFDEDLLQYVASIVVEMSPEEKVEFMLWFFTLQDLITFLSARNLISTSENPLVHFYWNLAISTLMLICMLAAKGFIFQIGGISSR